MSEQVVPHDGNTPPDHGAGLTSEAVQTFSAQQGTHGVSAAAMTPVVLRLRSEAPNNTFEKLNTAWQGEIAASANKAGGARNGDIDHNES